MQTETQIKLDECPLKGGIVNKARELCAKYGDPVVLEFNVFVWPDNAKTETWRAHVVGDGARSVCEQDADLAIVESKLNEALNPDNRAKLAIAKAVALEKEAAALRASVGGAA